MNTIPTSVLLRCGVCAGPLFVITFLLAGAVRAHYNPIRHPVSSLALGEFGWVQTANFIVAGLLLLAFTFGLWRLSRDPGGSTWGTWFVGIVAIGLIGAGVFPTDPVSGYPPGTPDRLVYTTLGILHDLFSLALFFALPVACLFFARGFARQRQFGWMLYSILSAFAFLLTFFLASLGFDQVESYVEQAGLIQRISLLIGFGWLTLFALQRLRVVPRR